MGICVTRMLTELQSFMPYSNLIVDCCIHFRGFHIICPKDRKFEGS